MANDRLFRRVGDVYIAHNAVVIGDVTLGRDVNLWFGVVIRGDIGRITLGPRVNLQDGVIVHTDFGGANDVEEGVVVGHGAILHGRRIGRDCLIGMGATVLSRSELGPECIVGAGCVVPEGMVVPPRSLVVGVPGKVIKSVTDEQVAEIRRINAHYAENAVRFVRGELRVVSGGYE
jgi:carbonic anhydrase/acetyltransferase-like protein (isoleucine patch superfamily)